MKIVMKYMGVTARKVNENENDPRNYISSFFLEIVSDDYQLEEEESWYEGEKMSLENHILGK